MVYTSRGATPQALQPSDTYVMASYDASTNINHADWYGHIQFIVRSRIYPAGTIRISADLKDTVGTAYYRIYKNWTYLGIEHAVNADWTTSTDDLSYTNWKVGDSFQIYVKGTATSWIRNVRVYATLGSFVAYTI